MSTELAASALAWWSEAGVDTLVAEEPRDWLKPKAPPPVAAPEAETGPADALPDTLDAFRAWLATATLPFPTIGPRLLPAGDPFAGLMVMIDMPSPSGGWFEGEADSLFDRMLSAMKGLSRERIYLTTLSPARAIGRFDAPALRYLAESARHHVGLAAPSALLIFGDQCAQALLGASVASARGRWHELETPNGPVPTMATLRPEQLVDRPNLKGSVWTDLQIVMERLAV